MTELPGIPRGAARRRAGIRMRITAAAASVVAVALLVGAVAFWLTLRTALYGELASSAEQDAAAFAEQVDQSGREALPDLDDDRFWQLIDRDSGSVIAASEAAEGVDALADREGGTQGLVVLEDGDPPFVTAAEREGGDVIVVAGRSTESADDTLATVGLLLAVAVPLIAAIVAGTTWLAVGRALAPVERMRREVEAVTSTDLHRRVEDPGTSDELGRLARTMNGMLARLEDAQAAQRRFISDASHELRSPLATVRQYAEVAHAHPDRVDAVELSEVVLDEGARLERLVQGMLVLTRADEGALALTVADVDLDDLLFAEARRLRELGGVDVEVSAIVPVRVRGDASLLRQVVRNLADNAARHARGRVAFASWQDGASAFFALDDDGAGIAPESRDRVFERFVRLDEARTRDAGGSGLGLAIVREILRGHGGAVRVVESPLGGARFEARLPL
ncbi:sensor histidine kinase [Micromonospora sp. DT81.3]|uniref:sensor histidine kinase n=1 Tax=Micromonospora sp. DT81.3 TaxID=3416523 RepID=UPI003CF7A617